MWDEELSALPNQITDISQTLERQFILRRFNKDHLKMEESSGSMINRIIGVGVRTDEQTGKIEPVSYFYPSYFRNVIQAFEHYPITKYFGLTPESAMNLPVDRWHQIRKSAELLKENQQPDNETQMLQLLKELIMIRKAGED